jgi:D-alanyl-D-alanine dipeptidase
MIVVTTENWESVTGTLQLFARETIADSWHIVGESENVMMGKNGLGWSPNFALLGVEGPFKQEGDGKAPAGVFYLSSVFGEVPTPPFLKMPYLQVEEPWICVDDIRSTYYNRLINSSLVAKSAQDWGSYEQMKRTDHLYQWGIVIDYNKMPIVPSRGSCIFLHLWRDSATPTAGCTAMSLPTMEKLLTWLDIDKKPVLVQLPQLYAVTD